MKTYRAETQCNDNQRRKTSMKWRIAAQLENIGAGINHATKLVASG
jgi:hypothetical protein